MLNYVVQALRMILQLGVKPSWFNTCSISLDKRPHLIPGIPSSTGDLRTYMIDLPPLGDPVVPEMLLKVLEPYRKEGLSIFFCGVSNNDILTNLGFNLYQYFLFSRMHS